MRARLRITLISALFVAVFSLSVASPAAAGDGSWREVPAVPTLHVRFEDSGHVAPCASLPVTPDPTVVECWSAHVDRSVSRRSSSLTTGTTLACVEAWEILPARQGRCPADAAHCVRPHVSLFQSLAPGLPIGTNISAAWALTVDLAREYTAFRTLRSGYALNPHRPRIGGLALSQGTLVLYRAHALTELRRALEAGGCGVEHLAPYFDLADRVIDEVARSDLPSILESYPPPGREWARRFHRVQLAVLGGSGGMRLGGKWRDDCERAATMGAAIGRLDADVNVWCGYAYELAEMPDAAAPHWRLARQSANHPEAASYASRRLQLVPSELGETTAGVR